MPQWIIRIGTRVMKILYRVSGKAGKPPVDVRRVCTIILNSALNINGVVNKLKQCTSEDELCEYYQSIEKPHVIHARE